MLAHQLARGASPCAPPPLPRSGRCAAFGALLPTASARLQSQQRPRRRGGCARGCTRARAGGGGGEDEVPAARSDVSRLERLFAQSVAQETPADAADAADAPPTLTQRAPRPGELPPLPLWRVSWVRASALPCAHATPARASTPACTRATP
jgi:hypothetical protein